MDPDKLWKLTGIACLAFGFYCISVTLALAVFRPIEIPVIVTVIILAFGLIYLLAGFSMHRKGRWGRIIFFGLFVSPFWWGQSMPWYIWPMMVMPVIILIMFILLFVKSNISREA